MDWVGRAYTQKCAYWMSALEGKADIRRKAATSVIDPKRTSDHHY